MKPTLINYAHLLSLIIFFSFTFEPVEDSNHFEIHTELFVHGNIFTFSGKPEDPGICAREVTPGWLHQITNGQFGKKSKFSSGTYQSKSFSSSNCSQFELS